MPDSRFYVVCATTNRVNPNFYSVNYIALPAADKEDVVFGLDGFNQRRQALLASWQKIDVAAFQVVTLDEFARIEAELLAKKNSITLDEFARIFAEHDIVVDFEASGKGEYGQ